MTKCCCKNPMSLLANPCPRRVFDWDRCVSRQKNTGKIWRVSSDGISITSSRRTFPPFAQKLYWDFFPETDPCAEADPLAPYVVIEAVNPDSNVEQEMTMVNGTLAPYGIPFGSGNYYLIYKGHITDPIPFDASVETIETKLSALYTIGSGNVDVTGVVGGPWTIEFVGDLAGTDLEIIKTRSEMSLDINDYQTVPGLTDQDQKLVSTVYGTVGWGKPEFLDPYIIWGKEIEQVIADGIELVVYLYILRGTWRLTLRYTDYNNGPGGHFDYPIETLRGVAHYTSGESGCFYDEPVEFTLDSYSTEFFNSGVPETPVPGEYLMTFPETVSFQTLDVGDFLD